MFDPHVGQDCKLWPHGTHTAKWPQGTNASARRLLEHTIHKLVAGFADPCCAKELDDDWDNDLFSLSDFDGSVSSRLSTGNPLSEVLSPSSDAILTQL
jgi:hypothetical protein